jgi:hypothetical protein
VRLLSFVSIDIASWTKWLIEYVFNRILNVGVVVYCSLKFEFAFRVWSEFV